MGHVIQTVYAVEWNRHVLYMLRKQTSNHIFVEARAGSVFWLVKIIVDNEGILKACVISVMNKLQEKKPHPCCHLILNNDIAFIKLYDMQFCEREKMLSMCELDNDWTFEWFLIFTDDLFLVCNVA